MTWSQGASPAAGGRNGSHWIFNPYLLLAFRLLLAAIFIYAAVQKIGRPHAFADEIHGYGVVDYGPPLYIMAVVLPWIELLCGFSLVAGVAIRGAALILIGLNAMFLVVIAKKTIGYVSDGTPFMKIYFDCGCGFGATYAWKKLLEDAAYLIMSLALFAAPRHRFVVSIRRRSS
ncbi:MAG: DoxX family membrane protein [Candidatus Krumholzibacteria bacterium]|nr:DoxX family membrane protein [Candidatus Krumholzibacteria bacterium]